jgi:hypothetical protein
MPACRLFSHMAHKAGFQVDCANLPLSFFPGMVFDNIF